MRLASLGNIGKVAVVPRIVLGGLLVGVDISGPPT